MPASLLLGDIAPNFIAETTEGRIDFYNWLKNDWCILFSHPKDFTPVCTTELGRAAKYKDEFAKLSTKIIALSVGTVETHKAWIKDIESTQKVTINYPLISDPDRNIAKAYGMIHPQVNENMTVRSVFIIDPVKKIRLTLTYPASTGRSFTEIMRVLQSIQLTDNYKVATPVDWKWGEDCVILPTITDPDELKQKFPKGWKEVKPYLRYTPQPNYEL